MGNYCDRCGSSKRRMYKVRLSIDESNTWVSFQRDKLTIDSCRNCFNEILDFIKKRKRMKINVQEIDSEGMGIEIPQTKVIYRYNIKTKDHAFKIKPRGTVQNKVVSFRSRKLIKKKKVNKRGK